MENSERQSFFVTGLPRTRGAWLAHYLNTMCCCEHEPGLRVMEGTMPGDLWPGILTPIGGVDSSFPLWAKDFYNAYGDRPIVIINREPLEVIESLKAEFPSGVGGALPFQYGDIISQALFDVEGVRALFTNVLEVDYDDIDSRIEDIVKHIGLGYRFDIQKFEYMDRFKIAVHPLKYQRLLDSGNMSGREVLLFG